MLKAIVGYFFSLLITIFVFWQIGVLLQPTPQTMSLISLLLSVVYFASLLAPLSIPAVLLLVAWSRLFPLRLWPVATLIASTLVSVLFAYLTNVMCRTNFSGADCWGSISFQITKRSPFNSEYSMVFWCVAVSSAVFWYLFSRSTHQRKRNMVTDPAV
jgi:hypothetical protein